MVTFNSIAGYKTDVKSLKNIAQVIRDNSKKKNFIMPKGLLLIGEPGVGKTLLSEAFINESNLNCYKADSTNMDPKALNDNLLDIFEKAIKNEPSIIFIDELDKLVGRDGEYGEYPDSKNTRAVLNLINKIEDRKVFILATANNEDKIDRALTRCGRFDKTYRISKPSEEDINSIISFYLSKYKYDEKCDYSYFAKLCRGSTPAEIKTIINNAYVNSISDNSKLITEKHLYDSIKDVMFEANEKETSSKNIDVIATHEAGHLIANIALCKDEIFEASIVPRSGSRGHVISDGSLCNSIFLKDKLNYLTCVLAGKAATDFKFPNDKVAGAYNDILKCKKIIAQDILDEGLLGFEYTSPSNYERTPSQQDKVNSKIQNILEDINKKAYDLVAANVELLDIFTKELIEHKTLLRTEIFSIYNDYLKNKKKIA